MTSEGEPRQDEIDERGPFSAEMVASHLRRRLPAFNVTDDPVEVPGGLLNVVWRVPAKPHGLIVKYAPPYVASAPDVPLDPSRLLFEARALEALGPDGRLHSVCTTAVRPPRLIDCDAASSILVMEDVGAAPSLGEKLAGPATSTRIGARLGTFIGRLHAESLGQAEIAGRFRNLPIQRTRLVVQYDEVGTLLGHAEIDDADALGERARTLGQRLLAPGRCLIHGDLWPRSVLVVPDGLRIIDWEFAHYGTPAQDLGHLAAHLWMHRHRAASAEAADAATACWEAFCEAYGVAVAGKRRDLLTDDGLRDAALHAGAEILVRTVGGFVAGYLYDGADEAGRRFAVAEAAALLRDPAASPLMHPLHALR